MSSALYKHPYEKGYEDGKTEGKIKGKIEGKSEYVIKLLTKKFGLLPNDIVSKIKTAEAYQLDLAFDNISDINCLEDAFKLFIPYNANIY